MEKMKTLIIPLSSTGSNFFPKTLDIAEKYFKKLIEETGAEKILALREDSEEVIPRGLSELAENLGLEHQCILVDRIDPSGWDGSENPDEIWSDNLETLIRNSRITTADEIMIMSPGGSGWNSSLLFCLYEITENSSIWCVEKDGNEITELTRKLPPDGSEGEAALASLANFGLENPEQFGCATDLQGMYENMPTSRGLSNTLGLWGEYYIVNSDLDRKGYKLTNIGRYNGLFTLARKGIDEMINVKGGKKGVIIFVRAVNSIKPDELINYLREHRSEGAFFDKFALVIGGFDIDNIKSISSEIHESAKDYLGSDKVVSLASDSFFSIGDNDSVIDSSIMMMEILQNIRINNPGIEWSVEMATVLAKIRPAVFQFAQLSGMNLIYISKAYANQKTGITKSELSGKFHLLHLPNLSQVNRIKEALNNPTQRCFIATSYLFKIKHPLLLMGVKQIFKEKRPYSFNSDNFPPNHPLRMKEISSTSEAKTMVRQLDKSLDIGVTEQIEEGYQLTAEGIVAGVFLLSTFYW